MFTRSVISIALAATSLLSCFPAYSQESPWNVEKTKSAPSMPDPVLTPSTSSGAETSAVTESPSQSETAPAPTSEAPPPPEANPDLDALMQDATVSTSWKKSYNLGNDRFQKGQFSAAANAFKQAQKTATKDTEHPLLASVSSKGLIRSYCSLKDYPKALQVLNEAFANQPPAALDQETSELKSQIERSYRLIDFSQFSPKAQEMLTEAQVQKIEVYPYFETDKTLVKLTSAKRFVKDTGSSDVPKIGVAKLVSFEFTEMPGQGFKIGNITGFQILAKMWVNLVESIFNTANTETPTAQVTAEKMGFSKTVSVNIPESIYKPLNMVLERITNELHAVNSNNKR